VALTGNIAAGKSSVAQLFVAWGATLIDADQIVRELQHPGEPVFEAIVDRFGAGVVDPEGQLDRAALRELILTNEDARHDLESLVHPAVAQRRRAETLAAIQRSDRLVLVDIPLLFEADDPAEYDAVVLVDAPEPVRRDRLVTLRGMTPQDADRLMATQLPSALKRQAADFVIDNDSDLATLEARARSTWLALQQP
jgi:dephospho-CoA kinase